MATIDFRRALRLYGAWTAQTDGKKITYQRGEAEAASHGLLLLGRSVDDGIIECSVSLPEPSDNSGAFVVFRASGQENYYAAGLGGWDGAYTLLEGHHLSWTRLSSAGAISNLEAGRAYNLKLALDGQRLQLIVDDVKVLDFSRLSRTGGAGIGLLAFRGCPSAEFGPMKIDDRRPNAFIAMQFSEPYNEVYRDAIRPLVEEIGYEPLRVDEISQPGIILNDIWTQLTEASVVIAEVTEANPNVYYEIGVAHALKKPTVLLAQKGTKLPFDLGPHRCIFYENSIPGRARLLDALRASLGAVLGISVSKADA
ncbi:MAG: hypothetical protein AB1640_13150 [bacterium]